MGEMGLAGPRPIVHAEVSKYGRRLRRRRAVKPGITGLWQVSGRDELSYRAPDYAARPIDGPGFEVMDAAISDPPNARGAC